MRPKSLEELRPPRVMSLFAVADGATIPAMPPRPTALDVARTVRLLTVDLCGLALELARRPEEAASTATEEGLARIRGSFGRTLLRAGVHLEVLHAEKVPRDGGLVFMWNQATHLDHLALAAAIPRPFLSLYNNEVARVPFYGAHMRRSGHFHVDRTDEAQWRASVARAAEAVRAGACVLVSPEGTRSRDGRLLPMKRGAFLLAAASQRPIVCVTVAGGHDRLPRGSPVVRAGPLRVVFSEPLATEGHHPDDTLGLQQWVVDTFNRDLRAFAV
ncbi:MAG: 1-acyl-sn-glycerol-3-phosphate acyltransferase [Deltaproteobacteria bacterium]|nr:1-acyl-sn-glycerol-3-phosphate acyltransferase [Deltaproteobacteria bacterium]